MFDAGLFEMLVIFTLGLLVLGPERLPKVARFVGRWVGQARRAVTRMNNEIERELALEEIRRFKEESEAKMRESERQFRDELKSVEDAVKPPSPKQTTTMVTGDSTQAEESSDTSDSAGAADVAKG
ncbi:MAG: Sec-independent protein translocase protein TatB [Pseudomonadota bacterium]